MKKPHIPLTVLLLCLFFFHSDHSFAASNDWVNINGTVTYNSSPVCTMVLANGQHMFTCSGDGSFNLDVPLDPDTGQITVFTFCSGLAPFKQVIYPSEGQGMQIEMAAGEGGSGMDVTCTLTPINTTWVRLEGTVSYNGTPVCAMVLANGQYMFTCSGDGSFSLDVPLDEMGNVTLFCFCEGLPPYENVYTTTSTVTLSGAISVPSGVMIDSDVNDPNETYIANDSLATAQSLPNPISLGGYVNEPGTGARGRSYVGGDQDDYFQVQCNAGDTIFLAIGDSDAGDLDLFLFDTVGNLIDSSMGTDQSESVTAPAANSYVVNVYAYAGASNYILAIGTTAEAGADSEAGTLSTRYEFVPGQVIVKFKKTVQTAGAVRTPMERVTAMGMTLVAGAVDREMLMTFDDTDTPAAVCQALGVTKSLARWKVDNDPALERKINTLKVIKALRQRDDVLWAEPNYILHHCATEPNDAYYGHQWHYRQINLPQAWDYTTGSSNVIVAVLDTGVLMDHPDLRGNLTSTGYDFVSSPSMSNDGDGIDADPEDPGNPAGTSVFHGTHCAGTVAATTDNSLGVAGVSWDTRIIPVRVLGNFGLGRSYDVKQGIRYAAGLSNDSGITLDAAQRADIINMSLGGAPYDQFYQDVINEARGNGVIIIASAGNKAISTPQYPASYDGVVAVSAVNMNGTLASYSNYGSYIDVAAPGGEDKGDINGDGFPDQVLSTSGDDSSSPITYGYRFLPGTSMAAPHVAGVVALMKALDPGLTPDELDTLLTSGAITNDIGSAGKDNYYGYGLIDALKAVEAAYSGVVTTALNVDPTAVNFGTSSTSAIVTVSKIGTNAISITNFSDDGTWLTVSEDSVDSDGLGTYTLQADRTGLNDGTHTATVTFTSSLDSSVTVQVSLQVSSAVASYNAGYHYVLLIDADDYSILDQYNVQASGKIYAYTFSDVPQGGSYLIVAGSDRDNDSYIDNPGESVGAYPTLDQITYVKATDNLSGLDFFTNLNVSISATGLSAEPDKALPQFKRLR